MKGERVRPDENLTLAIAACVWRHQEHIGASRWCDEIRRVDKTYQCKGTTSRMIRSAPTPLVEIAVRAEATPFEVRNVIDAEIERRYVPEEWGCAPEDYLQNDECPCECGIVHEACNTPRAKLRHCDYEQCDPHTTRCVDDRCVTQDAVTTEDGSGYEIRARACGRGAM